jgi:YebC/PmpR family DNA-binding regulatory protein
MFCKTCFLKALDFDLYLQGKCFKNDYSKKNKSINMAGHSKWANIKHRKAAVDAKKGKIFTKLNREITIAVKEGGSDPATNARLRLAIQTARAANMPKDNVERAISKAIGAGAENYSEVTYEGYAPGGVAVFVECTTDNVNRTVANVRSYFTKSGGSLGVNGSVDYLFSRKGVFQITKPTMDLDELTLELIDSGAEDVEEIEGENLLVVTCLLEDFGALQGKLEALQLEIKNAELQRIPATTVKVDDETFKKIWKLIDTLEDDDDVQKVYHNLEMEESQMELI